MYINEIFYSIEGEGKSAGIPTIFIRLQGCNLDPGCSWCDTQYARSEGDVKWRVRDIIDRVEALEGKAQRQLHVCITGGEPLYQKETGKLVKALKDRAYYIEMFTNGTISPPPWFRRVNSFVVDIKCPSSRASNIFKREWFRMRPLDQIKFVVADVLDLHYVDAILETRACSPEILISPMIPLTSSPLLPTELEWAQTVVEYCKYHGYRFSWQQQKLLWGNRKGV